jgi:hypothetical protein
MGSWNDCSLRVLSACIRKYILARLSSSRAFCDLITQNLNLQQHIRAFPSAAYTCELVNCEHTGHLKIERTQEIGYFMLTADWTKGSDLPIKRSSFTLRHFRPKRFLFCLFSYAANYKIGNKCRISACLCGRSSPRYSCYFWTV